MKKRSLIALMLIILMAVTGCGTSTEAPDSSAAPVDKTYAEVEMDEEKLNQFQENIADRPEFGSFLVDGKFPLKEDGSRYKLGVALPTVQEETHRVYQTVSEEYGKKMGFDVIVLSADNDSEKQIQQLQSFAAQGVDCVWMNPCDVSTIGPIVNELAELGIPVVTLTRMPVDAQLAYHMSNDNQLMGNLNGQYITETLGIQSGNFVILKGDASQITDVPQLLAGQMEYIKPYVDSGDINILLEQNCEGWRPEEAMKHAEAALTLAENDIAAFIVMNDGMASGVVSVLEQKGLDGKIPVTGMDCDKAALRRIAEGTQTTTIFKYNEARIQTLIDLGFSAVFGTKPPVEPTSYTNNGFAEIPCINFSAALITKDTMVSVLKDTYLGEYVMELAAEFNLPQ